MNKAELITRLEPYLGGRRSASDAIDLVVDAIIREVAAGGSVTITGFGTFERAERAARTGRNPRTGEEVPIAATVTPRFRPGTLFREVVSDPDLIRPDALIGGRAPAGSAGSGQIGAGRMPGRVVSGLSAGRDGAPAMAEGEDQQHEAPVKTGKSGKKSKGDKAEKSGKPDKGDKSDKGDKKSKKKSKKKNK